MKLQNEILNGESGISKKETRRRQEGEEVKVTNERMERRGEARGVTGRNNQRHDDSRSIFEGGGVNRPFISTGPLNKERGNNHGQLYG